MPLSKKQITELIQNTVLNEISLNLEIGDIVLGGKWKNKRMKVSSLGTDELGQPTVNGKNLLTVRIEKTLPKDKQSKETRETSEPSKD